MSNRLKRKPNKVQFNKEYVPDNKPVYSNYEYKILRDLLLHMQMMAFNDLRDLFGFGQKRLLKFWSMLSSVFEQYESGKITLQNLLRYCEVKGYDVKKWNNSITIQQRIRLACISNKNAIKGRFMREKINDIMLLFICICDSILKEEFKFSKPNIEKFNDKILYYIDSYTRYQPGTDEFYLTDEMINEILVDECDFEVLNRNVA